MSSPDTDGRPALIIGWRTAAVTAAHDLTGTAPVVLYAPGDKDWYDLDPAICDPAILVEDTTDVSAMLAALARAGLSGRDWAGVVPVSEAQVVPAAVLARLLGCPGPDLDVALVCHDKALQKALVPAAGLTTAPATVIDDLQEVRWGQLPFPDVPTPLVVKLVAGCGTVSTFAAHTEQARDEVVQRLADRSGHRTFIVEPFVAMDEEWEIDAVVGDGEIRFLSVGTYRRPNLDITVGDVHRHRVFDPVTDAEYYRMAGDYAAAAITPLGIRDAVIHLEAFHVRATGQLIFGECAIRPAGGFLADAVAYKHGVDLFAMHVAICCGRPAQPVPHTRSAAVGFTNLPSRAGRLLRHPSAVEVESRPGVVHAVVQAPLGATLADSSAGLFARTGMAVLQAPTEQELARVTDDLVAWVAAEMEVEPGRARDPRPVWLLRADQRAPMTAAEARA